MTKPDYHRDGVTLYRGDCLDVLAQLPERSVQCCVTSPPYFALRSYLPKGHPDKPLEIGSESSVEAFIATMVDVFGKVRRVLRDDGVLFLNLGDSYVSTPPGNKTKGVSASSTLHGIESDSYRDTLACGHANKRDTSKLAPAGNLLNVPHRVAEALRADGWIWRQTIVWAKRSPMPESVAGWRWVRCQSRTWPDAITEANGELRRDRQQGRNFGSPVVVSCPGCPKCEKTGGYVLRRGSGRCTTAHEYVFVMAKTNKYFWDSAASAEPAVYADIQRESKKRGDFHGKGQPLGREPFRAIMETRNPRSVWTLSAEPTKVRHFATFPSELVRRCLVAGISAGGCCPTCGAPWAPVVESQRIPTRPCIDNKVDGMANLDPQRHVAVTKTHGYRQTCECPEHGPIGCTVLDPFSGIGTTGQTARELGGRYVGIELHPEYFEVSTTRIFETPRWKLRKSKPKKAVKKHKNQLRLFGA